MTASARADLDASSAVCRAGRRREACRDSAVARVAAVSLLAVALAATSLRADAASYLTEGTCAGLPRVALKVPPGWCVALVADASSGLRFPRRVIEVAPGRFWIADLGSWEPGRGRLLQFELPAWSR